MHENRFIVFILLFILNDAVAQDNTRTVTTDSSHITIDYYPYLGKAVSESFKQKDLIHKTCYYPSDTMAVKYDYYTDGSGHAVGIYKYFDETGKLKLHIDEDRGIWFPPDTLLYPNYSLLCKMKLKGDSVVRSFYGEKFFNEHLKWNIGTSYYFDKDYSQPSFSISWTRDDTKDKYKATEFNIRYDLHYDNQIHKEIIRIIIDLEGNLLPSHSWNNHWTIHNRGLEKLPDTAIHGFNLTNTEAIALARHHGMQEDDLSKVWSNLIWEPLEGKDAEVLNGHFRMNVKQRLPDKTKDPDFISYRIWSFDPWTKEFLGCKDISHKQSFDRIFGSAPEQKKRSGFWRKYVK